MKLILAIVLTALLIVSFASCDRQESLHDAIARAITRTSQAQSYCETVNTTTYSDSLTAVSSYDLKWAAPDRHHAKFTAGNGSDWYELIVIGGDIYWRYSDDMQWRLQQRFTQSPQRTPGIQSTVTPYPVSMPSPTQTPPPFPPPQPITMSPPTPTPTQHPTTTASPHPTSTPPPLPPPYPPPTITLTIPPYIKPYQTPTVITVTGPITVHAHSAYNTPPVTPIYTVTVTISGTSYSTFDISPPSSLENMLHPLNWLVDLERLQDEEIDGVPCSHYRAKFDSNSYADTMETRAQEEYGQTTEMISEYSELIRQWEMDIELWVDGDDYIRQLKTEGRFPDNPSASTMQWGSLSNIMRYFDFNEPICIEPPEIEPE